MTTTTKRGLSFPQKRDLAQWLERHESEFRDAAIKREQVVERARADLNSEITISHLTHLMREIGMPAFRQHGVTGAAAVGNNVDSQLRAIEAKLDQIIEMISSYSVAKDVSGRVMSELHPKRPNG